VVCLSALWCRGHLKLDLAPAVPNVGQIAAHVGTDDEGNVAWHDDIEHRRADDNARAHRQPLRRPDYDDLLGRLCRGGVCAYAATGAVRLVASKTTSTALCTVCLSRARAGSLSLISCRLTTDESLSRSVHLRQKDQHTAGYARALHSDASFVACSAGSYQPRVARLIEFVPPFTPRG
jgi:hypothetical protein